MSLFYQIERSQMNIQNQECRMLARKMHSPSKRIEFDVNKCHLRTKQNILHSTTTSSLSHLFSHFPLNKKFKSNTKKTSAEIYLKKCLKTN